MHDLDELVSLQQEQLRHDQLAHADILCLPVQQRLTHMVLHFSKYTGALSQPLHDEKFQAILVDTLIIALATANALNVHLAKRIREETGASSFSELEHIMHIDRHHVRETVFLKLAFATGTMAKACESLDHLEAYDFRITLERQVIEVAFLVLAAATALRMNFGSMVRARWDAVERRSIFFSPGEVGNMYPLPFLKTVSR
jgi:hypothetical protein